MTTQDTEGPSPHVHRIDLAPFRGRRVLGEPLDVLLSAVLRLDFRSTGDDMAIFDGAWPEHEAASLVRAMSRVEGERPDEGRTEEERDGDRFLSVVYRVIAAMDPAKQML